MLMGRFDPFIVLDRFRGLFEKAGVDYPVMRRILALKFLMDGRRSPGVAATQGGAKEQKGNQFLKSLWIYGLMGIILIPMVLFGSNYLFQISAAMGIIMFMVMTSLISDFSSVLLDLRDRSIVLTRPVEGRTLTAAKTVHVMGYMLMITAALTGPSIVAGFIRHGAAFGFLYIWMILWMDLLIVVLTALLYLGILRFFDGEKLRDMINYIQIALSMAMAVGYQFVGRMFSIVNLEISFQPAWWQFLLPPVWFGALFEVALNGSRSGIMLAMAALALSVPVLAVMLYARGIGVFERSLEKLEQRGSKGSARLGFGHRLSYLICRDPREGVFFRFALNMVKTERDFKLRVYPSLGFSIIFPFIFLFNVIQGGEWQTLINSKSYLFIYFSALMMPTTLMMMKYSASHKGAWIYGATPVSDLAAVYKGTLKAFALRLLMPVFLLLCLAFGLIFGARIIPDLVLAFSNTMLYLLLCFLLLNKRLPFSEPFVAGQNADALRMFPMMFGLGAVAGLHYLASGFSYGIYVILAVSLAANAYFWGPGFRNHLEKQSASSDLTKYLVGQEGGSTSTSTNTSADGYGEWVSWSDRP
jgi:hypothetical protein